MADPAMKEYERLKAIEAAARAVIDYHFSRTFDPMTQVYLGDAIDDLKEALDG